MTKNRRTSPNDTPGKKHEVISEEFEAVPTEDQSDAQSESNEPYGEDVTPSWFATGFSADDSDELADRYRSARANHLVFEQPGPEAYEAYRRRLEERFQSAKRNATGPQSPINTMANEKPAMRPVLAAEDEGSQRFREWQKKMNNRNGRAAAEPGDRSRLTPLRMAGLLVTACAIGGLAGLGSANMDMVRSGYQAVVGTASAGAAAIFAQLPDRTEKSTTGGGNTVLTKKPVKIARVDVADASGALNNPIPLDLSAIPAEPEIPLALKITGLPTDAYLTQGKKVAEGEWMLKAAEIAGVMLVVPQAQSPQLDLAVAAVEEKTGVQAAPPREMTVELDLGTVKVQPAAAPPEVQNIVGLAATPLPQAIPMPQEEESGEARALLAKGEALLKTGDLVSARQFFVKAHGLGLAEAAFGAGQTYDPAVYAAMNVHGLQPDQAKALEWYTKAAAAGHPEAQKSIETLNAAVQP